MPWPIASSAEVLIPLLFGGMFVVVLGALVWGALHQSKKTAANLAVLADRLQLSVVPMRKRGPFTIAQPRLEGRLRGRAVEVFTYTTGTGKSRTHWCALTVAAAVPAGFTLRISGENFFTKAGRIFGVDDVKTGDAHFDEVFYVKSKQAAYVRAALIPEIRQRLLEAWRQHGARGSFAVEGREVKYAEVGSFANAKVCTRFPAMLEIAGDLAVIAEACRE